MRGIRAIVLVENESVAKVQIPPRTIAKASTAGPICDIAALDNFIQVAGLSLNTCENCAAEEAFMAVGIDDVEISASCDLTKNTIRIVYTSYTIIDMSRARADVAVLSADSALGLTINSINFVKLRFKRLRQLLGGAIEGNGSRGSKLDINVSLPSPGESRNDAKAELSRDEIAGDRRLQDLLESVLELSDGVISSDVPMGDLGMDSLGAAEIIDTLQSKFNIEEDISALPEMTFKSLCSTHGANQSSPGAYTPAESVITQSNNACNLDADHHDHEKPSLEPDVHSENTRNQRGGSSSYSSW